MKTISIKYVILFFLFSFSSIIAQKFQSSEKNLAQNIAESGNNVGKNIEQDLDDVSNETDTLKVYIGTEDSLELHLEEPSFKNDLLDMLHGMIFRDTTRNNLHFDTDLTESEEKYLPYRGQIIANIYMSKVPVFGGSVDDTLEFLITPIESFGNSLHINTKDWVIVNNLLFKIGDEVQPYQLADNERILRRLPFIRDARILVIPRTEDDDVDILVVTRDVFSLGLSIKARAVDDVAIGIFDKNLFGNGWEFRNTFRYRSKLNQKLDYEGIFDINNIQGSFIGMTLQYIHAYDLEQSWLKFSKFYLSTETEYAGGLDYIRTTLKDELQNFQSVAYTENIYDFWLGRSFQIGEPDSRRTLKIGARYFRNAYEKRPSVLADSNFVYHAQKLYLVNLMLDKREFLTSNMIFGFGTTEDIPTGYVYELTGGFSDGEFKKRPYIGLDFRIASWIDDIGYLAFTFKAATYMYQEKSEDGLVSLTHLYFSPLMDIGNYRFRHFFRANYITGINRMDDSIINIRDNNGIRALSNDTMDGVERLVINLESVAFTPWNLIGFQFSLYAFADFGWISPDKGLLSDRNFSSSLGFGCRIRNEGLVFQTLNLRIAYFPTVPPGDSRFDYDISTFDPALFRQFSRGKPGVITFE